jgi:hypothetical protein
VVLQTFTAFAFLGARFVGAIAGLEIFFFGTFCHGSFSFEADIVRLSLSSSRKKSIKAQFAEWLQGKDNQPCFTIKASSVTLGVVRMTG